MARLQIFYLPPRENDPNPFAIIIDQVQPDEDLPEDTFSPEILERIGARAIWVFPFTVDVV